MVQCPWYIETSCKFPLRPSLRITWCKMRWWLAKTQTKKCFLFTFISGDVKTPHCRYHELINRNGDANSKNVWFQTQWKEIQKWGHEQNWRKPGFSLQQWRPPVQVQLGLQLHWSVAFSTPIDNISIAVAHEVESLAHDIVKICEASGFCIPVLVISPSLSPLSVISGPSLRQEIAFSSLGRPVLVTNVASRWGFTKKHYKELIEAWHCLRKWCLNKMKMVSCG